MPDPEATIQFDADRGDARLRLDQVLVRRITSVSRLSRRVAQRWIESGAVTVNGRIAQRPSARVPARASIVVAVPASAPRRTRPQGQPGPLDILYEDEYLLVVNKPAGLVVHPSYKQISGTLLNAVLWRVADRPDARPGILTRLDKHTSGLVVVALTAAVHATMQRDAAAGYVSKQYLAIVCGDPRPPSGVIALPLARDPGDRRRVVATSGGAPSETRYGVMEHLSSGRTLVRCELVTGRTHQIRVHMASSGWPILGDPLYGQPDRDIPRQALHAWRVVLPHPVTRVRLELEAPPPPDIRRLLDG